MAIVHSEIRTNGLSQRNRYCIVPFLTVGVRFDAEATSVRMHWATPIPNPDCEGGDMR
jgi:hypothetical protein